MEIFRLLNNESRDDEPKGFMLVEVLVALFIISLLMVALIKSTSDDTRTLIVLKNKTIGEWVASNVFDDIQLGNISPSSNSNGTVKGEAKAMGQSWYWITRFQKMGQQNVWRVDIEVKPTSFEHQSIVHLTSYYSDIFSVNTSEGLHDSENQPPLQTQLQPNFSRVHIN
jgi:type II secretion system protein I